MQRAFHSNLRPVAGAGPPPPSGAPVSQAGAGTAAGAKRKRPVTKKTDLPATRTNSFAFDAGSSSSASAPAGWPAPGAAGLRVSKPVSEEELRIRIARANATAAAGKRPRSAGPASARAASPADAEGSSSGSTSANAARFNRFTNAADAHEYSILKEIRAEYDKKESAVENKRSLADDFIAGTCSTMCSRFDFLRRIDHGEIDPLELTNGQPDYAKAVMKYYRSSAGANQHPDDIRTEPALLETINYLLGLIEQHGFDNAYRFVQDRVRALRKDVTTQRLISAGAATVYEQIVRFHLVSFLLYPASMDWVQDVQQLNAALTHLLHLYDAGAPSEHEFEFRCYEALVYSHEPHRRDALFRVHAARADAANRHPQLWATVRRLAPLIGLSSPLPAAHYIPHDLARVVRLMRTGPLGLAAAAAIHLDRVRRDILHALVMSGKTARPKKPAPGAPASATGPRDVNLLSTSTLAELTRMLHFASEEQCRTFLGVFGVDESADRAGRLIVNLDCKDNWRNEAIATTKPATTKFRPQFMDKRVHASAGFSVAHFVRTGQDSSTGVAGFPSAPPAGPTAGWSQSFAPHAASAAAAAPVFPPAAPAPAPPAPVSAPAAASTFPGFPGFPPAPAASVPAPAFAAPAAAASTPPTTSFFNFPVPGSTAATATPATTAAPGALPAAPSITPSPFALINTVTPAATPVLGFAQPFGGAAQQQPAAAAPGTFFGFGNLGAPAPAQPPASAAPVTPASTAERPAAAAPAATSVFKFAFTTAAATAPAVETPPVAASAVPDMAASTGKKSVSFASSPVVFTLPAPPSATASPSPTNETPAANGFSPAPPPALSPAAPTQKAPPLGLGFAPPPAKPRVPGVEISIQTEPVSFTDDASDDEAELAPAPVPRVRSSSPPPREPETIALADLVRAAALRRSTSLPSDPPASQPKRRRLLAASMRSVSPPPDPARLALAKEFAARIAKRAALAAWRAAARKHKWDRALTLPVPLETVLSASSDVDLDPAALYRAPSLSAAVTRAWLPAWHEVAKVLARLQAVSRAAYAPWAVIAAANHAVQCLRDWCAVGARLTGRKATTAIPAITSRDAVPRTPHARPIVIRMLKDAVTEYAKPMHHDVQAAVERVPVYNLTVPFHDILLPVLDAAMRAQIQGGNGEGEESLVVVTGAELLRLRRKIREHTREYLEFVNASGDVNMRLKWKKKRTRRLKRKRRKMRARSK
ncbi:actin cytoskeleton and mitosis protein [Blastocladiella emersonii ATCC 22665]|nr:actin cytoskeleton and mitosis protein [Blastocladiella emersonii ATCC 22665]